MRSPRTVASRAHGARDAVSAQAPKALEALHGVQGFGDRLHLWTPGDERQNNACVKDIYNDKGRLGPLDPTHVRKRSLPKASLEALEAILWI